MAKPTKRVRGKDPEAIAEERISRARSGRNDELDLSGLRLTRLPETLWELTSLRKLDVRKNCLASLPEEIGRLERLSVLLLNGNMLSSLPRSIGRLTQLFALDLTGNRLSELPEAVGALSRLNTLILDGNELTELPDTLRQLTGLQRLHLHSNPELGLPSEVLGPEWDGISRGQTPASPDSILAYYFETRAGSRPLNEAKLILVGRGEVGKTCLVNRLVRNQFVDTSKTAGIRITDWGLRCGSETVQLHIWDFGGQEIMHATHQFFLTERSLYLLVLNGREGGEDHDVEYWLKLISSFGADSPVIVVLNKVRQHPFDLNYRAVREKYPQVRDFVKTDCKKPLGIGELRKAIAREIGAMPDVKAKFPVAWFQIKDTLAHMKESLNQNYISYERYQELCGQMGEANPESQERLAGYLHCLGVALNYRDDPRLRETSLLNPHWVTNGIYRLLNAPELALTKGELTLDEVGPLLPARDYPPEKHAFLVELMRKFRLCFAFEDGAKCRYLVPELLGKEDPDTRCEFEAENCLNFEYRYGVLPEGLLPGFIVRSNVLSEGQPRWRSGVVLEWNGCRALVKADVAERRVSVSVRGGNAVGRRELLAVIRSDFERIHREIPALDISELVPLPEDPSVKIGYDKLIAFEREGCDEYHELVGGRVAVLNVRELLGGVDLTPSTKRQKDSPRRRRPLKLFISYSHKDDAYRERLEVYLKLLERERLVAPWSDRRIAGGDDWRGRIDRSVEAADIVIALVSADFLASDYCQDVEMVLAMERHAAGQARVIPVLVRKCDWESSVLGQLQALPTGARPVSSWGNRDAAWTDVVKALRTVIGGWRREGMVPDGLGAT